MDISNLKKNWLVYLIIIISIIYILGIAFHKPYFLGPPDSTQWRYLSRGNIANISLAIFIGIAIILNFYFFSKKKELTKNNEIIFLIVVFLLNIFFLLALINITEGGITNVYGVIHSPNAAGYFTQSSKLKSPSQLLNNYSQKLDTLEQHVRAHPPGAVLTTWKINNLLINHESFNDYISTNFMQDNKNIDLGLLTSRKRTGLLVWSIFLTILIALTPLVIYLVSKLIFDQKIALISSTLWLLVPANLLFYPNLDLSYALFSSLILFSFYKTLYTKENIWPLLLGTTLMVALFFTYAFFFFFIFILLVYLLLFLTKKRKMGGILRQGTLILLPIIIFYSVLMLFYNFNTLSTFFAIKELVTEELASFRPYHLWVFFNIFEFMAFLGIPLFALFMGHAYNSIKSKKGLNDLVIISFIISFCIFNFSGTALGEVARVWIFIMPFFVIFAAKRLSDSNNKKVIYIVMFIQLAIIVIQKLNIRLIDI